MSNRDYPRLRRPEIVQLLNDFQIATVTENDISNPKSAVVFHLYTHILNYLLPEEYDEQLEFNALEHLENPDLHVGSVPVIKLYNKIKEMLNALECPQKYSFNFADLLKPDPRRTEFFLGTLLSFCIHWNEMMNSISSIIEEINTLEDERAKIEEDRIMQLTVAIDECKEVRGREMPYVQEVDPQVKELRQNIANLNNKQMSLRTDLKKLKEKTVEMDDKISDAEYRLIQSVQENANLRSKIVQSPDKIQRALEEKKLAREKARNAERLAMHNFHKKTALIEVYDKVYKKMSNHCKKVQAIQEQAYSAKSIEKGYKALKAKLDEEEVMDKSLEVNLAEWQSKVEHMEGIKSRLDKECIIATEEGTNYPGSKKSEVESKRCDIETRKRHVDGVLSKADAVNSRITLVKESARIKVDQLDSKCEEIEEEFHKYANSIAHVIESGQNSATIKVAGFDNMDFV